ncbi:MAG: ornithine carbamoyltransferase, partial [Candidatus Diapherotrites archaeon]
MHLVTLLDWEPDHITQVIDNAIKVKGNQKEYANTLNNKTLCMLFQKTSTRTRVSFEAGMTQLGGHAIFLDWRASNFTLGAIKDEIRCLDRYSDIIMARVYKHADIKAMADASNVPVINALCNLYHPCQTLADLMTMKEKKGDLKDLKIAFVGDGNNVCNSTIIGGAKVGANVSVATPKGFEPHESAVSLGKELGKLELFNDPAEAVKDAD